MPFGVNIYAFAMVVAGASLLTAVSALGQSDAVTIRVNTDQDIGIYGYVRRGDWTPLRVHLTNHSSRPLPVICQWIVADNDGDNAHYYRHVTLTPHQEDSFWLYAPIPASADHGDPWILQVLDAPKGKAGEVLARQIILPPQDSRRFCTPKRRFVGVTGRKNIGLTAYETHERRDAAALQHESTTVIAGIDPGQLPDRWYGLSMLEALIWTPEGGDPDAPGMLSTQKALLRWIERGGQLVIVMPSFGDPWSDSFLVEAFPKVRIGTLKDQNMLPDWISSTTPTRYRADFRTFEPLPGTAVSEVSQLLEGGEPRRPLVVTSQHGFGRVTLIGVDITDRQLGPQRPHMNDLYLERHRGLWGAVFGWLSPAWPPHKVATAVKKDRITAYIDPRTLDDFLPTRILMTERAAPALLAAILVFGLYWLVAGPLGFAILKTKQRTEHAWLLFTMVVGAFTVLTWGGAALLRPSHSAIKHFTVVDVDAESNLLHAHSWASLFMARHRPVTVAVDTQSGLLGTGTIASIGLARTDRSAFLDSQHYRVNAAAPSSAAFPMRATARQIEADYLGPAINSPNEALSSWVYPQGKVRLVDGRLEGEIMHNLPGPLQNVIFIYCPGPGATPKVIRPFKKPDDQWHPRAPLNVSRRDGGDQELLRPPAIKRPDRKTSGVDRRWSGYLAGLVYGPRPGDVLSIRMLSFFNALPPPDFYKGEDQHVGTLGTGAISYERRFGRHFDLSHLLALRRLIVIGDLQQGPLPLPLTADGRSIQAEGWTVVRWVCRVE